MVHITEPPSVVHRYDEDCYDILCKQESLYGDGVTNISEDVTCFSCLEMIPFGYDIAERNGLL